MKPDERVLPFHPPRNYRLGDTWRGRVWRNPGTAVATDLTLLGVAAVLAGVVHDSTDIILVGGLGAGLAIVVGQLSKLFTNLRRARLVREGPVVEGHIDQPRRVLLLHELFRGENERTFVLPFHYTLPSGQPMVGKVWICGCVKPRLPRGSAEHIVYDPDRPRRSMPLRLAVMKAPH